MIDARPLIGGGWYPHDPEILLRDINAYLKEAPSSSPAGKIHAIVVPHAGYRYSGKVAAHAFKCLNGLQPDVVVALSPVHFSVSASLVTTAHEAYRTPFGLVEVDREKLDRLDQLLKKRTGESISHVRNDPDHALEVELPFLQHILGEFRLLPIMMVRQNVATAETLGHAIAEILSGCRALLVASSDLSHFYSQEKARRFDHEIMHRLEGFNPKGVIEAEEEGVGYACGRGAIAAVLWAARDLGADRVSVLCNATSGEVTGDFRSVVGYGSAVVWQSF